MAFFEEGTMGGSTLQVEAIPTHIENYHEAALAVVAESESNYNSLMQAIGMYESKQVRESGECVYTEGAINNFWQKVKKFFVAIIAKIKGIFHSFMSRFDAQFKSGKNFFDKYKKEIAEKFSKIEKDKVKFTGYNFVHHDTANTKLSSIGSEWTNKVTMSDAEAQTIIDGRDKVEEVVEGMRGELIGGGKLTASEFSKELFTHFRSGESSKSELDHVDFAYISKVLSNGKLVKTIEDSYKNIEKGINDVIKACDKAGSAAVDTQVGDASADAKSSAQKKTAAYPIVVSVLKSAIAIKQTYVGAQMQAIANEVSQAKQFAAQVIRASVKEASWTHFDEGASDDFLGAVKFQ